MKKKIQNEIKHEGKVLEVTQDELKVEILAKTACSACNAKTVCAASSAKSKIIAVKRYNDGRFAVGDDVYVIIRESLGFKAVLIAYLIPLFILIFLLLTLSRITSNELITGLVPIGSVIVYYAVLALFRKRLRTKFIFTVKKLK